MSSAAYIEFEEQELGVDQATWALFCTSNDLVHSPRTMGGNVWDWDGLGGVEVHYEQRRIRFSTFFHGKHMPHVARLALQAWVAWGGTLQADQEIRYFMRKAE